ncbi:MAG: RNA polymerase sporulation sigma factor SigK [Firmicutes bacterium]|nr:RNA polymerase sporulation sigma factor SigK [Bacillota bacterium]
MQTEGVTYMGSSFPKPLTEKEEQYYVQQMEKEDPEAKNILIERNLRLVAHIAKKYTGSAWTQDDLISIGTIGLIKAVNTYTSKKSTRLATYAARCIENEILMSIRASRKNRMEISLNLPIGTDQDGNEISFNDILGTDDDEILDAVSLKIQVSRLYRALGENLTPRERQVLFKRYGLGGEEPLPQREIAEELGISRSYVSRIEKKALEKLKLSLKDS